MSRAPPPLQVEAAQAEVHRLDHEVGQMYRDKARLLEELVSAGSEQAAARRQAQGLEAQLAQVLGGRGKGGGGAGRAGGVGGAEA